MRIPRVKILQEKVDHAVGQFIAILCDEDFLKKAVEKNTADLPDELRTFVSEKLITILHEIRDDALEESSKYYKKAKEARA